jgi:hypothetical protein
MSRLILRATAAVSLLSALPLEAQKTSAQVAVTAPLEQQYVGDLTALRGKVMALAEAIPEGRYRWRPSRTGADSGSTPDAFGR